MRAHGGLNQMTQIEEFEKLVDETKGATITIQRNKKRKIWILRFAAVMVGTKQQSIEDNSLDALIVKGTKWLKDNTVDGVVKVARCKGGAWTSGPQRKKKSRIEEY
jgi:hypothetical protein